MITPTPEQLELQIRDFARKSDMSWPQTVDHIIKLYSAEFEKANQHITNLHTTLNSKGEFIRHWQHFAKQLADLLGCCAMDDDIIEHVREIIVMAIKGRDTLADLEIGLRLLGKPELALVCKVAVDATDKYFKEHKINE
jgi:hypothetical protein